MSPVPGSTSVLGARPRLGLGNAVATALTATSAATSLPTLLTVRAAPVSTALTWSGVHVGWTWSRSATTPEVTAAAIDVPPRRMYWPLTTHDGHCCAKSLPGASVL